jgi:Zn ribbon nucleic-acid-binding protein
MKTAVSMRHLVEFEIRPNELMDEFYRLSEVDVRSMLVAGDLQTAVCPACESATHRPAFEKIGISYHECADCGSVYATPRPDEQQLMAYYRDSAAAHWWRQHVAGSTEVIRRDKVARPLARWVVDTSGEHLRRRPFTVIDLSPMPRLFAEELVAVESSLEQCVVTHPLSALEYENIAAVTGVTVAPMVAEELALLGPATVVTAFDVLDRCASVSDLLTAVDSILAPGGLFFFDAPCISGFELQTLWDRARSITPPDRLNILSLEGFARLAGRWDWTVLEFSTPGMLDVEIVRRALGIEPEREWPRFARVLVEQADQRAMVSFQEFLQTFRLSSFARLVLQKSA